jgi:hypothetical protein
VYATSEKLRKPTIAVVVATAAALAAAGCATHRPTTVPIPNDGLAHAVFSGPSNVIARSELSTVLGVTAGEAVRRLRPQFLEGSQPPTLKGHRVFPLLYIENRPFAGIESLDAIPLAALDEVRFLKPAEAKSVYGRGCACDGGVIVLRMRRDNALRASAPRVR